MSSHVLNGTCNPSLSVIPLSLTIMVPILVNDRPIVQSVHLQYKWKRIYILFFYRFKEHHQSQVVGVSHHIQW
jgi:hypothetical protein